MYDPYSKRSVWTDSEKCNVYSVSDRWDRWDGYRHAIATVIAKTSGWGERAPPEFGIGSELGDENTFYLSSKKRLYRRGLAIALHVTEYCVVLSSPMWGGR